MRFLQPYLNNKTLGDGIEAYDVGSGVVLVPLGEIARLLRFGIKVSPDRTDASGAFITKRTFSLDLNKGSVEVDGHMVTMPRVVKMPLDIYVDAKALGEWFPLEVDVYLEDSSVVFKSREKLPIQEQWDQQDKYGSKPMSLYGWAEEEATHGVYKSAPYSFIGVPMVDLNLGLAHSSNPSTTSSTENATIGGDLLWMSSDIFANRDTDGSWNNSRATLFREDPTGKLLGPLHAKNIEMGDLFIAPSMDLVGTLPQGRGLDVDNFPVTYRTRFSTKTFRGSLTQGWSVEIFQNDTVIGFQQSRSDGLYEFKDVPLRFGVNTFKLVFHGPLGERIDKTYRLDISQAQPPPGAFYYGVAGVKPTQLNQTLAYQLSPSTPAPDYSKSNYMIQGSYGLSKIFSIQGGATGLQLQDGFHSYETVGLRCLLSFCALQFSTAQDHGPSTQPGIAYEGIVNTGYGYSTLSLRRDQYKNNFERSAFDTTGLGAVGYILKDATGVDLNWSAPVFKTPFSVSAQLDKEDYVGGTSGERARYLISTQIGQVMLTNSMTSLQLPTSTSPLQGALTATTFTDRWSWNGSLSYTKAVLNGWSLLAQYNSSSWQYQAGIKGPIGSPTEIGYTGPIQVSAGISKMTGNIGFGFNVQESAHTYSASLQLQISFGREPRTGKWSTDAQSLATGGAISAVAFIDAKGTGKYEPGDLLVEGAKVKVGGGETVNQITDPAVTFVTKLPKSQAVDISLDESSLDDPSQKAVVKTVTIIPRYGKVTRVEFAITSVGEVNGTTRLLRDGKRSELGGLEVELLDSMGKQVKLIRSSYDGFYEFTDLPYGDYLLRATPAEVRRMNIKPVERKIQFKAGHNFLDGIDLIIEAAQ